MRFSDSFDRFCPAANGYTRFQYSMAVMAHMHRL
jgi:hypothetical protein